jgi:polyisoprenoid-binding protein YceI
VYRIQTAESRLLVRVGRAGPMKNLGHDHVIASEDIEGLVMLHDDPAASRADLLVPLQRLVVDKAEYRAQLGVEGEVSESAIDGTTSNIDGTTSNMQDKVLESAIYPWAQISARFASAQSDPPTLSISVTLHGTAFEYLVPVDLKVEPDRFVINGEMTLRHTDFGLTPFSAMGGLLRVADELELQFALVARPLD